MARIIDKNVVSFGEITEGTIFRYEDEAFMKTDEINNSGAAINLESGFWYDFSNNDKVVVINATIVIE